MTVSLSTVTGPGALALAGLLTTDISNYLAVIGVLAAVALHFVSSRAQTLELLNTKFSGLKAGNPVPGVTQIDRFGHGSCSCLRGPDNDTTAIKQQYRQ